jgi:hypothetical protein
MELALIISAIGLGFASGFHCIGMCGPIALSMGLTKNRQRIIIFKILLTNSVEFLPIRFWEHC